MSVSEVAARIGELQAHFALLTSSRPGTPTTGVSSQFSAALADAAELTGGPAANGTGTRSVPPAGDGPGRVVAPPRPAGLDRPIGDVTDAGSRGGVTGQAVVQEARKYLGVPYEWGGTDPDSGLDCSGFIQLVYKRLGFELPRVSYQQATAGRPVDGLANAQPGDILAFNSPVDHVAIYLGNNKMIEAARPGTNVRISEVYQTPSAIRRILPNPAVPQESAAVAQSRAAGDPQRGLPFAGLFERAADRYDVDATLLAAVAKQESGYNPRAVSPAGAQGLMQLMPATAAGLGVDNPFHPAQAVDGAARLLRDLLRDFGRVDLALAAYNAGPGAVHRYNGIPPYPETQHYVTAVMSHQQRIRE